MRFDLKEAMFDDAREQVLRVFGGLWSQTLYSSSRLSSSRAAPTRRAMFTTVYNVLKKSHFNPLFLYQKCITEKLLYYNLFLLAFWEDTQV